MTTTLTSPEDTRSHQDRDFGMIDAKGRRVGATVYIATHIYTPSDNNWGHAVDPGTYYAFRPTATRDGASFGAVQASRLFTTTEERDAAIADYFAKAEKRARKNRNFTAEVAP